MIKFNFNHDPYQWSREFAQGVDQATIRDIVADGRRPNPVTGEVVRPTGVGRMESAAARADAVRRAIETNNGQGWSGFWDGGLGLAEWWAKYHPGEAYVPETAAEARRADKLRRESEWARAWR